MTCFSAVLISHFSVPFIQLHRAVTDLPWCCKSPLPHRLRKVLSVKDTLQSWSPLAKQVVDLCNDLPGILVGLGQGKNLTTCSPFPALCSIWKVMLPSSFFPRVWWVFFFSPFSTHSLCPEAPHSHPRDPAQAFPGYVSGILWEGQFRQVCANCNEASPLAGLGETLRGKEDGCAGSGLLP